MKIRSIGSEDCRHKVKEHNLYDIESKPKVEQGGLFSLLTPALLVFFPATAFCLTVLFGPINLPLRDDYDTILHFANALAERATTVGRMEFFLADQSNEYKLYLLHAVVWMHVAGMHPINFKLLIGLGNLCLLVLGVVLWKQFLPSHSDLSRKLMYFVPVSCLLFQLRDEEAVDWSTASLQHMPCLLFSFAAIYLIVSRSKAKFWMALTLMVLAIGSSGNGFLLVPVGFIALSGQRQYLRASCWLSVSLAISVIYFYHYTRVNLQATQSLKQTVLQVHPTYFFLFLGSVAARPLLIFGTLLGLAVCVLLACFALTGGLRRQTGATYCMLYLLLTALGVACLRGNVDPVQISTSRYTIYSALVLIFCWVIFLERRVAEDPDQPLSAPVRYGVVGVCMLFTVSSYVTGLHAIRRTNETLRQGMAQYERSTPGHEEPGPVVPLAADTAEQKEFETRARQALDRAVKLGFYTPPAL